MERYIGVGDTVTYKYPLDAGEAQTRFSVLEDRGVRVLVEEVPPTKQWAITPAYAYFKAHMILADERR